MKYAARGLLCGANDCYFEKPCNETLEIVSDLKLEIDLYYGVSEVVKTKLTIRGERLLVPGQNISKPASRCYLGVFVQTNLRKDGWYLGTQIMADYYTVFDMTPISEHNLDFAQVGFAPMNPQGLRVQEQPRKVVIRPTKKQSE